MKIEELNASIEDTVKKAMDDNKVDVEETVKTAVDEAVEKASEPIKKFTIQMGEAEEDKFKKTYGFKDLGDFACEVMKATGAAKYGNKIDERLEKAAGTGLTEGSGPSAGWLIPEAFAPLMSAPEHDNTNLLGYCNRVPLQVNNVTIPYPDDFDRSGGTVYGGIKWYWISELEQKTSSYPKMGKIKLELNEIAGLCYVSDTLLQDSPASINALITNGFKTSLVSQINEAILYGTGAGQPLGISGAPALTDVAIETGQDDDTIVLENVLKMRAQCYNYNEAIWLVTPDAYPQIATLSLAVGTGGAPIYQLANDPNVLDSLLGRPILVTNHCAALGTVGDIQLINFKEYIVGEKSGIGSGIQAAQSIHLKFDYDQTAFRFIYRIDGNPWWSSALQPIRGNAVSPFIRLASRT